MYYYTVCIIKGLLNQTNQQLSTIITFHMNTEHNEKYSEEHMLCSRSNQAEMILTGSHTAVQMIVIRSIFCYYTGF